MMNEKLYSEMCSFLSDKELILNEFRLFYDKNKDSDKFIELFDEEYGAMYEAFKGSVKYPTEIPNLTRTKGWGSLLNCF